MFLKPEKNIATLSASLLKLHTHLTDGSIPVALAREMFFLLTNGNQTPQVITYQDVSTTILEILCCLDEASVTWPPEMLSQKEQPLRRLESIANDIQALPRFKSPIIETLVELLLVLWGVNIHLVQPVRWDDAIIDLIANYRLKQQWDQVSLISPMRVVDDRKLHRGFLNSRTYGERLFCNLRTPNCLYFAVLYDGTLKPLTVDLLPAEKSIINTQCLKDSKIKVIVEASYFLYEPGFGPDEHHLQVYLYCGA